MKTILEYIISKSTKVIHIIHATDDNIKQIVRDELDRLGNDADLNHINVSEVTNMSNLFSSMNNGLGSDYKDLNPDISEWDMSNVKNTQYMFYGCNEFNCDISKWDVSKVENMSDMFSGCKNFNQDISGWNVSKVKDMSGMFDGCTIFNQDISKWNVSKVENMYIMFQWSKNFNQDISQWDVRKVKNMNHMFNECRIKEEFKPKFKK